MTSIMMRSLKDHRYNGPKKAGEEFLADVKHVKLLRGLKRATTFLKNPENVDQERTLKKNKTKGKYNRRDMRPQD